MVTKLLKKGVVLIAVTLILLLIGAIVWHVFQRQTGTSYQDVLFWIGAIPVSIFSLGYMGRVFGKGNVSYQSSHAVTKQPVNESAKSDLDDFLGYGKSGLVWIGAGLSVWAFSLLL